MPTTSGKMPKTYSQKVARGFEIMGYLLLIPAFYALSTPAQVVAAAFRSGDATMGLAWGLAFVPLALGLVLLAGYIKHSRRPFGRVGSGFLWVATIVFNFLLMVPFVLVFVGKVLEATRRVMDFWIGDLLIWPAAAVGYLVIIVLAFSALWSERDKPV
ncbi:MAG: hypothetical protein JSS81_15000 [Acidobacteria bacterium]|nr:hypothetical protein [Acidobacteriota bacterium]